MSERKSPLRSQPSPVSPLSPSGPASLPSDADVISAAAEPYGSAARLPPSRPLSVLASTTGFSGPGSRFSNTNPATGLYVPRQYFHSRRIRKRPSAEIERPWTDKRDPREKWVTIIPCMGVLLGLAICGALVWQGLSTVVNHKYCPVLTEDWSQGIRKDIWTHEIECGGFGNGQFEYTTDSLENSYIQDGALHIKPTLQDASLITSDSVLNLTAAGTCTSSDLSACVSVTNLTKGTTTNPVKSARLNTKLGASITYGRVEVRAKLPAGQWLWPAIWMLPVQETYGPWPASGEMDIAESRGNNWTYPQGGNDKISSTLHWGPDAANDAWWRTNAQHRALHTTYADKFHTFGIEWSEGYIFTYVDSRLLQVMYTNFNERLWERGDFPLQNANGTKYVDPWSKTGRKNTPFDQPFYLVINVAVGATNGWFKNGDDGKPWVDGSGTERRDFWDAQDQWLPTWKNGGEMVVESVKMWQQCG